jgi:hypothetical protein
MQYSNNYFGTWTVTGKSFQNKRNALLYASNNGCPSVSYSWHDSVWKNFDTSRLGKQALSDLYRERAQQLRDTYDYLILSYSGGADSHNILMAFLDNNIKLDQIFAHQPFSFINSSYHTPNTTDKTSRNMVSEWDYCVKPTLDYVAKNHPDIKIELSDWMSNVNESYFAKEDTFLNAGGSNNGMGPMARNLDFSKMGLDVLKKDKTIATIYGHDKPLLWLDNKLNRVSMIFTDVPLSLGTNAVGTYEPFYWSEKLPDLMFEMAYQVYLYFKSNPHLQKYMWSAESNTTDNTVASVNHEISKSVCYPHTWDFRKFQSDKPNLSGLRQDRDFFIYEFNDYQRVKDVWKYHREGFYQGINKKYIHDGGNLKVIKSNTYYLGDL